MPGRMWGHTNLLSTYYLPTYVNLKFQRVFKSKHFDVHIESKYYKHLQMK